MARTTTAVGPKVATLVDPDAERRFLEDGYVVVDWLDRDAVDRLLALAHRIHDDAPEASPWACDFYSDDPAVKEEVGAAIGEAFAPAVAAHLTDHVTYLHAFVVNWPGLGGGLPLHQHSSVVDEPDYRSAVVWCALTDLTEETGTLSVVPRSHHVQVGPKAERSQDWFEGREEALLEEFGAAVHLRAGQALVFDNALLHASDENRSGAPRITAVATLAPRAGGLRYFSSAGEDRIEVYRLEPRFFVGAVSRDFEWARPEGLELLEVRPATRVAPSDGELRRLLDPDRRRRWWRRVSRAEPGTAG